ncbi:NUDIX domain-containing protein [Paenibacillus sp. FSL K6-3182]|uniref:NUDIX domain-containing protein n=1 Tax=unclassified Paenibacillus TaxID=185978 RepID=UPI0030D5409D
MNKRIIVTGGAIIKDEAGRILLQRRSDYGDWGLPGGGMEAGEKIEDTMIREVLEETGLHVTEYDLYSIYTGPNMQYRYPDGNEVVFVMFIFNVAVDLTGKLAEDGKNVLHKDSNNESLQLVFTKLEDIDIECISSVQKQLFRDLLNHKTDILRG